VEARRAIRLERRDRKEAKREERRRLAAERRNDPAYQIAKAGRMLWVAGRLLGQYGAGEEAMEANGIAAILTRVFQGVRHPESWLLSDTLSLLRKIRWGDGQDALDAPLSNEEFDRIQGHNFISAYEKSFTKNEQNRLEGGAYTSDQLATIDRVQTNDSSFTKGSASNMFSSNETKLLKDKS
jgi:hypothetical protein